MCLKEEYLYILHFTDKITQYFTVTEPTMHAHMIAFIPESSRRSHYHTCGAKQTLPVSNMIKCQIIKLSLDTFHTEQVDCNIRDPTIPSMRQGNMFNANKQVVIDAQPKGFLHSGLLQLGIYFIL